TQLGGGLVVADKAQCCRRLALDLAFGIAQQGQQRRHRIVILRLPKRLSRSGTRKRLWSLELLAECGARSWSPQLTKRGDNRDPSRVGLAGQMLDQRALGRQTPQRPKRGRRRRSLSRVGIGQQRKRGVCRLSPQERQHLPHPPAHAFVAALKRSLQET